MTVLQSSRLPIFASVAAALLVVAGAASAQDRCEGTLCDLYYEHMAKPTPPQAQQTPPQAQPATRTAAQPAQAQAAPAGDGVLSRLFGGGTPPQQPTDGAAPAKKPLVAVQGGGVVGLMQGRAPSRCTGTLCDFYYGGPPPEEPAAAEPAAAPASAARAEAEMDEPPIPRGRGIEPRESTPHCSANPRDPWACYR